MKKNSFYKGGSAFWYLIIIGFSLSYTPTLANKLLRQNHSLPQQTQISGTITDGLNPLTGVTISIKGKAKSTAITDFNGQYTIEAAPSDTLVVTFIGFKTAIIPIGGRKTINIRLQEDITSLQEVRVNAGYYSVKESERTGSISKITSKNIEIQPVTNVLAAMQGRMAGVSITQTTGVPGGGFEVKIRGQNSLRPGANAPLYVIDGVPYSSDPIGYNQTSTIFPTVTSPLNSINPDNIESIEVLKDADATSIYGSRGANGVVLVTTKKGKAGKTKFSVIASTGSGQVTSFMKLMNTQQYLSMRAKAFINDGLTEYQAWDYDTNGTWDQNRYTNWQEELIGGTAEISKLQGTVSGGSETTQFLFSGNYHTESTVFPGDFLYKLGGAQFSLNHRSEDTKFKMTFSANYNAQDNDQPAFDFTYDARALPPNAPALYDDAGNLNWENGTWDNPLRNLAAKFESKTNDLLANTVLSYEIAPALVIKSSFGYTDLRHTESRISPSTMYNPSYGIGSAYSGIYLNNTSRSSWIVEPQINWEKELGKGKLNMLFGGTFQNQGTSRLFQSGTGFSSNSLIYDLASAANVRVKLSDETLYKYQAFFTRINYNWQERYILNLTGRRDGSSRFGPGNQFAYFGAVGAAWLFSNETFLKNNSWFSFGKLRASYGTTGNDQIGDYQFLDTYSSSGTPYDGVIGLQPTRLFNPDFGWETNKKMEVAMEAGFLHDNLFLTAAWYRNRSSNQLVGVPLAGTTGFSVLQSNLDATVENTGFEFTLRTLNFSTKNFNWSTSLNLTIDRNKLLRFPGLEASSYKEQYRINQPLNIQLLYKYTGLDPQTGVYQFEDVNNDGKIAFPDDRQTVVDLNPEYFGGLQNQLGYKRWKLDFLFQFVKQKNRNYPTGFAGQMSNQPVKMLNSWQQPGDNGPYQIYTIGYNDAAVTADYLYSESDAAISDASFIRLKNIALSYDLPLNVKNTQCKIMLQSQNLLTFTKYEDGDPEFTNYGYLPPLKVITAGIQLTF
ncbi:SusC/RagA family TonB-linked outer membrane protein [Flavobacterium degerlachei]|uniref:TonB-linked outer membrane protein, SusC/RagA family n=1 Tax=Flavobacterium degerlachei TaxID=229203 RepID=A0A1H3E8G3_9FLAO|nr:SusC/RagA family TonB-linked outer membrane protein [Flavobacterium degerlachei]SDX74996.1 TonB-linked outer membrane protein, SusC/RagA family [Flavobacterium degerlachei]